MSDVRQEATVTMPRPADVPLHVVLAARHRLEAGLLEGTAHMHLVRRHPGGRQLSTQWVFVMSKNRLCGTKRCFRLDVSPLWVKGVRA